MSKEYHPGRRQFLKRSAFGALGLGATAARKWVAPTQTQEEAALKIKEYRILGRTGFKVADIGAGAIMDDGVLGFAMDSGVNYLDTAEEYPGHHRVIAKALKGRDRKLVFITTKLEVKEDKSKEGFLKRTRKCLEELGTDYVDCLMMHGPEKAETLKTEGFHAAMKELRSEGRVKYVGVSHHGSFWFRDSEETMEKVLMAAAEDGRFDVFLLAYNFLKMDESERVLEVCRQKKIGTALMKTAPVAIYYSLKERIEEMQKKGEKIDPLYTEGLNRFKDKADRAEAFIKKHNLQNQEEIKNAAIRFCLENPNVNTVCCLAKTYDEVEKYIRLSGTRLNARDEAKLTAYRDGCGELYCRQACGVCEPQCPKGVPVNTIMRYQRYFAAQGREREAMSLYSRIPGNRAEACRDCSGYCETACPYRVPVQGMLLLAHSLLTLA